jgi:hypothetical protein
MQAGDRHSRYDRSQGIIRLWSAGGIPKDYSENVEGDRWDG